MQHQHRQARGVADRRVAHLHLRHDLAGVEGEVLDDVLARLRLGKIRRPRGRPRRAISAAATSAPPAILHIRMSASPFGLPSVKLKPRLPLTKHFCGKPEGGMGASIARFTPAQRADKGRVSAGKLSAKLREPARPAWTPCANRGDRRPWRASTRSHRCRRTWSGAISTPRCRRS